MWLLFIVVCTIGECLLICLMMESLWDVDRDVSTAILLVLCSTLVRCYWRISILIIIPNRCCPLTGPICYRLAAALLDCGYPCFRNFDSTISIDGRSLMWMASLTLRVYQCGSWSINLTSFQIGKCPVLLACSETAEVWVRASSMSLSCSFILSCIALSVFWYTLCRIGKESYKPHHLVCLSQKRL